MFTGLVSAVGTVLRSAGTRGGGRELEIAAPFAGLALGESVAVDGVCLTVDARARGAFTVRVVPATLARTNLAGYRARREVNLERALRAGDRLGGHIVAGHVDGVGEVVRVRAEGDDRLLDIRMPAAVARVTVPQGSITVDGVSLTVQALPRKGVARVALIPATLAATTLGAAVKGTRLHLEADQIGKLVAHLVQPHRAAAGARRR